MAMTHGSVITEERSQITSASAETVWRIWSDTTTWPKWNPDVRLIELNGFFDDGVKGTMRTGAGTYHVMLADVVQEECFTLVTSQAPLTTCYYRCTLRTLPDGITQISESISLRGPLAAVIGPPMRERIAQGFVPALKALAAKAESIERLRGVQPADDGDYAELAEQGANG